MKYVICIDQSTSATKAMLFDTTLRLHARVSLEHRQIYPKPGWMEHDAEEILDNTRRAVAQLLRKSAVAPAEILSIALTNQRETVVVWDKASGKPVCNAVVWQCDRGEPLCRQLREEGHEPAVTAKTGLFLNPYFSASGVAWILDHVEGARERAERGELLMGTIDSWLLWNLTPDRVHATDYTNASRTLLFNIHRLDWDDELLALFRIPRSMMPAVHPCDTVVGTTTVSGLLPRPVPVAGMLGDSHGALVGQMCFDPGMGKATYGTGSSVMVNIGQRPLTAPKGLATSVGFAARGKVFFAFEGNIHCTGATIKWLQEELQLIQSPAECEALARSVESTNGVYLVPAFAGLGAPWWQPDVKALICGMTQGTGRAHIARAALEAIAYQIKDLMTLIETSGVQLHGLRVDGGPTRNNLLMQFQADMLGAAIDRSPVEEASALGALVMSLFALGEIGSFEEAAALRTAEDWIRPTMDPAKAKSLYDGWKRAARLAMRSIETDTPA